MRTDKAFDEIFHRAEGGFSWLIPDWRPLQNFQNSDFSYERPKCAQEVASCFLDFLTMLTLGKSDLAEMKESTKDAFRSDYFLEIDGLCCEFESRFVNDLPLLESISALDVDSPHFLGTI